MTGMQVELLKLKGNNLFDGLEPSGERCLCVGFVFDPEDGAMAVLVDLGGTFFLRPIHYIRAVK